MAAAPAPDEFAAKPCRLGVIVINYRTPDLVEQCVRSMLDDLAALDARIVIVDNASGDGSVDALARWRAGLGEGAPVDLIASPENTGFSGGNNIGFNALDAEYYLLINSDALVRPGALAALLAAMEARPRAGVVAPRLEDRDGTAQISAFRHHTPLSEFIAGASLSAVTRLMKAHDVPVPVSDTAMEADWVSFACVMIRRAAVDAAGLMDDGFFMYYEDADYCRAVRRAGFEVVYDPSARVVHLRGGSSPVKKRMAQKKRPPAYYYASRTRYFRKSFGPAGLFLANAMWMAGRALGCLRLVAGKAPPPVCEGQGRDIWMNWRTPLRPWRAPARPVAAGKTGGDHAAS